MRAAPAEATRPAEACVARETRATCQLEADIGRETRGDILDRQTPPPEFPPHPSPLRRCLACFRAPALLVPTPPAV